MNKLTDQQKREAFDKVIRFCHAYLFNGKNDVLPYLYSRGITDATIRQFQLGAFPKNFDVLSRFVGKSALYQLGLLNFTEDKQCYSKFKTHKLIIPVYDHYSNPVAVIGRALLSDEKREKRGLPKYINTFYKKSKCLFGLNNAKDIIRTQDKVFVVEGNFDVITAVQNGMKNVVASSGTFLSRRQLALLARYTGNIKILFDNDDAGQEATKKIVNRYNDCRFVTIKAARLPAKVKDLDEYFHTKTAL